jgi:hypothetical protein
MIVFMLTLIIDITMIENSGGASLAITLNLDALDTLKDETELATYPGRHVPIDQNPINAAHRSIANLFVFCGCCLHL